MKEVTKEEVIATIKEKEEFNSEVKVEEKLSNKCKKNRSNLEDSLKLYQSCHCGSEKKYKFCCKGTI